TPGHRVVEDEAGAADQVPGVGVVDRAVVAEELEEPARRIDAARMVEAHGVGHVREQEPAGAEIGQVCTGRRSGHRALAPGWRYARAEPVRASRAAGNGLA